MTMTIHSSNHNHNNYWEKKTLAQPVDYYTEDQQALGAGEGQNQIRPLLPIGAAGRAGASVKSLEARWRSKGRGAK